MVHQRRGASKRCSWEERGTQHTLPGANTEDTAQPLASWLLQQLGFLFSNLQKKIRCFNETLQIISHSGEWLSRQQAARSLSFHKYEGFGGGLPSLSFRFVFSTAGLLERSQRIIPKKLWTYNRLSFVCFDASSLYFLAYLSEHMKFTKLHPLFLLSAGRQLPTSPFSSFFLVLLGQFQPHIADN